jgi:molybdenum cofactor synthesis domain-containing protein
MEIICVGNELLIGKTLNTNATWLAKRVTTLGLTVKRITVVGDDVDEIAGFLHEVLLRKPEVIVTTGGLGPTFDDKTLEGIAKGLGRRLEVNRKALAWVREKYAAYLKRTSTTNSRVEKIELTAARTKMATLPEGAEPLPNPAGTAPGVLVKANDTFIIALPGVPPEMEAIFEQSCVELIRRKAGKSRFYEKSIFVEGIMESDLAPLIDITMRENPLVYIKSHVYLKDSYRVEGKKSQIELHFSTTSDDAQTATEYLENAISELSKLVRKNLATASK